MLIVKYSEQMGT